MRVGRAMLTAQQSCTANLWSVMHARIQAYRWPSRSHHLNDDRVGVSYGTASSLRRTNSAPRVPLRCLVACGGPRYRLGAQSLGA